MSHGRIGTLFRRNEMNKIRYRVVKHDGGWAYETDGTYSGQFRTREAARKAARLAAADHAPAYATVSRTSESEEGQWLDDSG
jgi:Uncharacterized protein conserved in bacteria (DUF2188)